MTDLETEEKATEVSADASTVEVDIFADAPMTGELPSNAKGLLDELSVEKQQGYQPKLEDLPKPSEGDSAFSTHTTGASAPPKKNGAGAPSLETKKETEPESVTRGRVWRQAVHVVIFIDKIWSSVNGFLLEKDPKTLRADKEDIKLLCDTVYDWMREKKTEIAEEMSAALVFITVYGWDTGAGVVHRASKWWKARKEEPAAEIGPHFELLQKEEQKRRDAAQSAPQPKREEKTDYTVKTEKMDVRVCKHPDCGTKLGNRQGHFCTNDHQHKYAALRAKDPSKYADIHTFTRFKTPEGKFKKVEK